MTRILRDLPILEAPTVVRFGDRHVTLLADQILLWVGIGEKGVSVPEQHTPWFPALLDTGNNFNFTGTEHHLVDWAGIRRGQLRVIGDVEVNRQRVFRYAANLWLYPNVPGSWEIWRGKAPFPLELERGIAVYPPDAPLPGPRLPLVGVSALLGNELDLWIDPLRRRVFLHTADWRTYLFRLLS